MSTVTTSSLSDTLPSTVPKLDAEGDNWAIFLVRFMDAVEAKGFWGHFDGSLSPPVTTDYNFLRCRENCFDSVGERRTFCENVTYPEVTGFYGYGNTLEEDREGEVGGRGEGIYS